MSEGETLYSFAASINDVDAEFFDSDISLPGEVRIWQEVLFIIFQDAALNKSGWDIYLREKSHIAHLEFICECCGVDAPFYFDKLRWINFHRHEARVVKIILRGSRTC